MDADTRELLACSIRELLRSPGELVAGLPELGWAEVVFDDAAAAIELLFTEQGRAGAATSALDGVVVDAAGAVLASRPVLVVHSFGGATSSCVGDDVDADGVTLAKPESGASYVILVGDAITVPIDDDSATEVKGLDPASGLRRVRLSTSAAREQTGNGIVATPRRAVRWPASWSAMGGRCSISPSIRSPRATSSPDRSGPSRRRDTALPMPTCNCRLPVSSSRSPGPAASRGMQRSQRRTPALPLIPPRACLQVRGAMGLTAEHPPGNCVKGAHTLDALHGGWQHAMRAIGEELPTARAIPQGVRA